MNCGGCWAERLRCGRLARERLPFRVVSHRDVSHPDTSFSHLSCAITTARTVKQTTPTDRSYQHNAVTGVAGLESSCNSNSRASPKVSKCLIKTCSIPLKICHHMCSSCHYLSVLFSLCMNVWLSRWQSLSGARARAALQVSHRVSRPFSSAIHPSAPLSPSLPSRCFLAPCLDPSCCRVWRQLPSTRESCPRWWHEHNRVSGSGQQQRQ